MIKTTFYCKKCQITFDSDGTKKDFKDPVYGNCWKIIALCPSCKNECAEKIDDIKDKAEADFDEFINKLIQGGGCKPGGGCC